MPDQSDPFDQLVHQMWRDPSARSRNKNFSRYRDDPLYRRAHKLVRTLLALQRDLDRYGAESRVDVRPFGDQIRLHIVIPSVQVRRTVYLSRLGASLLGLDPEAV